MPLRFQHSGSQPAERRCSRLTLCLGLLCLLLLLIIAVLCVYYKGALSDMEKKRNMVTKQRDLLQIMYNKERTEKNQLQANFTTVRTERDQLQTNYSAMSADVFQLQEKYSNCAARKKQEHRCPSDWKSFSLKCYFISNNTKSWTDSQEDCRQRGADLVVIDSEEEQTFLRQFQRAWIGLTDRENEGVFKWVDGTPLTTSYWMKGEPNDEYQKEDCTEILNISGALENWNDMPCSSAQNWICEREGFD